MTAIDISPEGKRAVLSARGDIYTVPAKEGSVRNLTQTPGIRENFGTWSPDGKWIAYISDRSGEDEIYLKPQDGTGPEVPSVTSDGSMFRFGPMWSPDSKKLIFADKAVRLFYVDIDEQASRSWSIREIWEPHHRLFVVARQPVDQLRESL